MELFPHRRENGPYVGDRDQQVLKWVTVFVGAVSADREAFGLTELDIYRLTQARDQYIAAYDANTPARSNRVTVSAKNVARKEVKDLCRMFAMQIKNDGRIWVENKIAAGIRPRPYADEDKRTPIGEPRSFPVIQVIGMGPGTHTIRFMDVRTQPSGRKPPGATNLLLFAEIALPGEMTGSDDALRLIATPSRNPFLMQFDSQSHDGKYVRYKARWMTAKGLWGPWSASTLPIVIPLGIGKVKAANQPDADEGQQTMKLAA